MLFKNENTLNRLTTGASIPKDLRNKLDRRTLIKRETLFRHNCSVELIKTQNLDFNQDFEFQAYKFVTLINLYFFFSYSLIIFILDNLLTAKADCSSIKIRDIMKNSILFSPIRVGAHELSNRRVIAPKVSLSAQNGFPSLETIDIYTKQSEAELIITEPTTVLPINREDQGYLGIYTLKQARAWRTITEAVHEKGKKIFLQLWHCGLMENPYLLDEKISVTPNRATSAEKISFFASNSSNTEIISQVFQQFRYSAQNALAAEFDGVEIHSSFGGLIDWLVYSNTDGDIYNFAEDIERRAQLLLGVVEAVANVIDEERVGVKISPNYKCLGLSDPDPEGTFYYLADALNLYNLAYVHLIEPPSNELLIPDIPHSLARLLRSVCKKKVLLDVGNNLNKGLAAINNGDADLISSTCLK